MRKLQYVLGVLGAIVLFSVIFLFAGMGTVRNLRIQGIDLSDIADGTYQGQYQKARWNYKVNVTVKNHKVTSVTFADSGALAQATVKITDELTAKVAERGTTKVDVVSGATVTSKAFLKAIENALSPH